MSKYAFSIYFTFNSANSQWAISNLFHICREELYEQYKIEIAYDFDQSQATEAEKNW